MCDWGRQAIDVINGSKTLYLHERGSGADSELRAFTILKSVGHGNSAYVYEAEYSSGNVKHICILKELFPKDCGLKRDEEDNVTLYFSEQNEASKAAECKERYETLRQRYLEAYRIQSEFRNARYTEINNLEDKMLLAVGVSTPIGLYENKHGILYSVYESSSGISYNDPGYKDGSLWDILSVIIQTGNVISTFHRAGYIVLDIKESNILITGNKDHRTAIQFDFDSLVKKDILKNFHFSSDKRMSLSFSNNDDLLLMPKELNIIHNNFITRNYEAAAGMVRTFLGKFGERTDIFLLAAVLFRRLFRNLSLKNLRKNNWEIPDDASDFFTMPIVREELKKILSRALAADIDKRYDTIENFLDDLRDLRTLSVLENEEDRKRYAQSGIIWEETDITKNKIRYCSCKHWKELSGEYGKFSQLVKFAGRFNSKVSLEDEQKKRIMPYEAMNNNRLALLMGDGGMGKSTAVFDYWTEQIMQTDNNSKICLYVDLSHFSLFCEKSWNESRKNGLTADFPTDLLTFIEINILQKFSITPTVARPKDAINDTVMSEHMSALNSMLSQPTDSPEFMVILDGYNEILNSNDRKVFEMSLSRALKYWKNAAFVVTSRAFDQDSEQTGSADVFKCFSKFVFVGISEADIEKAIMEHKNIGAAALAELKSDRLWEILKIPMFLNMYLALHTEDTVSVHTRGELLDRFILTYELQTTERINLAADMNNTKHTELRKFLVRYSLPFAANYMDKMRSFSIDEYLIYDNNDAAFDLYINNKKLRRLLKLNSIFDKQSYTGELDDLAIHIFKVETGYCYDTSDGEVAFIHQYYRDYFAAKHIQNILTAAEALEKAGLSREEQLDFIKYNGLDYTWSDDVCLLLGEIIGDYKNEPGYKEE